jgi:CRISPR system Cascade subunit CasC
MILELHLLQNFAPSCLNRDDTNSPKDCEFGGHRRARISSQCIKRAIRLYFQDQQLFTPADVAVRTARLVEHRLVPALVDLGHDAEASLRAARAALGSVALKLNDKQRTLFLLFIGPREIKGLIEVIHEHFDTLSGKPPAEADAAPAKGKAGRRPTRQAEKAVAGKVSDRMKQLLDGGGAVDLALFGRMFTGSPALSVDAAVQVAHALSTNRVAMDMDYFTAVDDLQQHDEQEGAGAGMLGTVEFNSSCFYRYFTLDLEQLAKNLQQHGPQAEDVIAPFVEAAVKAIPSGKQNTFAAHNPPDLVLAVLRESGSWSLANAFVRPIGSDGPGLVANSAAAMLRYWQKLIAAYGHDGVKATLLLDLTESAAQVPPGIKPVASLDDLVQQIQKAVPAAAESGAR